MDGGGDCRAGCVLRCRLLVVCMGECTETFWIRFRGAVLGCRLLFNWWCVWVSVLRFFGFFGRGCLEVWSAVQLVVCMGECTQVFWILWEGLS